VEFLSKIYGRKLALDDIVTVIHFSRVTTDAKEA
jgi:hypothetical protein